MNAQEDAQNATQPITSIIVLKNVIKYTTAVKNNLLSSRTNN